MIHDLNYKDVILTQPVDLFNKLDCLYKISSPQILKEVYWGTKNLLVKREIVRICDDEEIYQKALDEKNEMLKIAVIRAIHKKLKVKWALADTEEEKRRERKEEKEKENKIEDSEAKKLSQRLKDRDRKRSQRQKKKAIAASALLSNLEVTVPYGITPEPVLFAIEANAVIETTPAVEATKTINLEPESTPPQAMGEIGEIEVAPIANTTTKRIRKKRVVKEKINPEVISNIFNLYTLVALLKEKSPYSDEVRAQIERVLKSQEQIETLLKM